jgi:hypothetical protein
LRFLRALPENNAGNLDWIFQKLQLSGHEGKNLVPVDWVTGVTAELLDMPSAWGQTYHLTNAIPVTANQLSDAIAEAIGLQQTQWDSMALPASITDAQAAYQMHVDAYRGYLADDPIFDTSNLHRMLPNMSAPEIDHQSLVRMLAFAIENRFRDPTIAIPRIIDDAEVRSMVDRAWHANQIAETDESGMVPAWTLRISGTGGGVWTFGKTDHSEVREHRPWVHLASEVWNALVGDKLTLDEAISARSLLFVGAADERSSIRNEMSELLSWCKANRSQPDSVDENDQPTVLPLHNPQGGRRFA